MNRPLVILLTTTLLLAAPFAAAQRSAFAQTSSGQTSSGQTSSGQTETRPEKPEPARPESARPESTAAEVRPDGTRPAERPLFTGDVIYLPGPDGKLVPVPVDKTLEEFLQFQKNRPAAAANGPGYSMASISLDGDADEDRAQLTATIRVQVNDDATWIRVPLQLNEVVLKETKHTGPGDASFGGVDRETGHRWWLRGKGMHELTLTMIVPIRRQNATRRLQMSLPPAAASELLLRVPFRAGSIKVTPETAWMKSSLQEAGSTINVRGLGTRFDLSWQPLPAMGPSATALQVQTAITLDLTGDPSSPDKDAAVLEAQQVIEALQGSFQELHIRLPAGFELNDVDERQGRIASVLPVSPDDPTRFILRLTEPTPGPVVLQWNMESAFPAAGATIAVDGFDVSGAIQQSGEIVVEAADGHRVTRRESEDRSVHRSRSKRAAGGKPGTAWRFLKQPFRIVFDVREIEPYFTVEPKLAVRVAAGQLTLDGRFRFDVAADRGPLKEVVVEWPGWKAEGWSVQPIDSRDAARVDPEGEDAFRIQMANRRTGTFELPFRATRAVPAATEAFEFSVPRVRAATPSTSLVDVICDDNLEAHLREIPVQSGADNGMPNSAETDPRFAREWKFRIQPAATKFAARRVTRKQEVSCLTSATVERRGGQLLISERLSFDVRYEPLAQFRLRVPPELESRLVVALADGEVLTATSPGAESTSGATRYTLPAPQLGRFDVLARFSIDLPDSVPRGEDSTIRIPLIQPSDANVPSTEVRLDQDEELEAKVDAKEWRLSASDREAIAWSASGSRSELAVSLVRNPSLPTQDFSILRGWLRTEVDVAGASRTVATYVIGGRPAPLIVRFPPGVVAGSMTWDGQVLLPARIGELPGGDRDYRFDVPDAPSSGRHRLTVELQSRDGERLSWLHSQRLVSPAFPTAAWVQQVAWEVVLPSNYHLFAGAAGFTPQYDWTWSGTHFSRQPTTPFDNLERWVSEGGPGVLPVKSGSDAANAYVFTRFGGAGVLTLTTISSPMLILLGAGAAWIAGFLLLKVPAARSVMTLLSVTLAVALLCLEFSSSVGVLLQPALIGLVLAGAMAAIEHRLSRDSGPAVLTISPASDAGPSGVPSSLERIAAAMRPEEVGAPRSASERPSAASAGSAR